ESAQAMEGFSQGKMGRSITRIEPNRLAKHGDCLPQSLLLLEESNPEVGVGVGVVGAEPDGLATCADRLIEPCLANQLYAQVNQDSRSKARLPEPQPAHGE